MLTTRAFFLSALLILLCVPSRAQTSPANPAEDLTALSIEDLVRVKVFSASRHLEEARGAPAAVTVVTAAEIATFGWRTLGDVLNSVRGFYTAYDRNYTYLGVRGLLRPGDYNSRVLFLINGHRMNDNIYDDGLIGTEFPLDLDLVERIEIVRGPGSSLYGTNAAFGVVNIITRKPRAPLEVEVAGSNASLVSRSGRITLGLERRRASALLSASLYRSDGQEALYFPEFSSTNSGRAINADGDASQQLFADLRYKDFRLQALLGSRRKIVPTASFGTIFNDPGTWTRDTRGYLDFSYHHDFERTDLTVRSYYDRYRYRGVYAYDDGAGRYLNMDYASGDWAGIDFNLGRRVGRHRITVGAEYEYSFRADQDNFDLGGSGTWYLHDSRNPWRTAVYGEAEFQVVSKLTLTAGGRIDYFGQSGGTASPRIAAVYQPNSRTTVKYIFGRAFRAPNPYQAYYADGFTSEANPALSPETVLSHTIVLERTATSWLLLSASLFQNSIGNLIDNATDPATGLTRFVNVGHMRARGLGFEALAGKVSGFNLRASYTATDARDPASGSRLNNAPVHLVKLHGQAPIAGKAKVALEVLYGSAQESYTQARIPPALLTNLSLSTPPLRRHWELSASCYNLFDRRWYSPPALEHLQKGIEQDGRAFRVKLTYRFSTGPEAKQ